MVFYFFSIFCFFFFFFFFKSKAAYRTLSAHFLCRGLLQRLWSRLTRLTLNNEVDVGGAGLVVGLDGARVGPLVGDLHLVDVDGEVAAVAVGQRDALVQRPLVRPGEQDVGAVEPGLVRHLLVDPTPAVEVVVTGSQNKRHAAERRSTQTGG